LQLAALPVSPSMVQALPSSQLAGHIVRGSQVSPASTTPLLQVTLQSLSLLLLQPAGQQESPGMQLVMSAKLHATLQLAMLPTLVSVVHAVPSLQSVGQKVVGSQVSPTSVTPLPQLDVQSASDAASQPAGQQPSPFTQALISV
jgi:hypothetical protein